jgi:hypothetical protein
MTSIGEWKTPFKSVLNCLRLADSIDTCAIKEQLVRLFAELNVLKGDTSRAKALVIASIENLEILVIFSNLRFFLMKEGK